jgi:hypothetical protein
MSQGADAFEAIVSAAPDLLAAGALDSGGGSGSVERALGQRAYEQLTAGAERAVQIIWELALLADNHVFFAAALDGTAAMAGVDLYRLLSGLLACAHEPLRRDAAACFATLLSVRQPPAPRPPGRLGGSGGGSSGSSGGSGSGGSAGGFTERLVRAGVVEALLRVLPSPAFPPPATAAARSAQVSSLTPRGGGGGACKARGHRRTGALSAGTASLARQPCPTILPSLLSPRKRARS